MDRRRFLLGLAGAGLTEDGHTKEEVRAVPDDASRRCPPALVALELRGKFENDGVVEDADAVGSAAFGRLVIADLDDEGDWGELNPYDDRYGRAQVEYGDDERGYWHVARAYEFMEPTDTLHDGREPVWFEITLSELADLVLDRLALFSS